MEKLTRSQFKAKYGFDPYESSAPSTGAISGSVGTTQPMGAKEMLAQIRGGATTPSTQQPVVGGSAKDMLTQIRSGAMQSQESFKPNKFVQAMEDYRPDYIKKGEGSGKDGKRNFADISKNINEGFLDFSVGSAKALTRMPVNIIQALTFDKMFGENSLLNSDSERAQAFESATKGNTGLQKTGATAFDIASLFVPVGGQANAATKGLTLAQLASKGAGTATKALTGTNTGMLASGLNRLAPLVGESVATTAMLGGDAGDVGLDVGIGLISPFLPKIISGVSNVKLSPATKASIAEVVGSSKMADDAIEQAVKIVNENGPELEKTITSGRKIMREMFKDSQIGEIFGGKNKLADSDAIDKFNEVSDVIMHSYLPEVGMGKRLDWTNAFNKLEVDELATKEALDMSEQLIGKLPVNTNDVFIVGRNNLGGKFNQQYKPIINEAVSDVQGIFNKYLQTSGLGTKSARSQGILPLQNVDAVRQGINNLISEAGSDQIKKKVYMAMKSAIDTVGAAVSNKAGLGDIFQQYLVDKNNYSFLQDTKEVLKKLRDKNNPFTTTQITDHLIGLSAGGVLNNASNRGSIGALAYYSGRLISKLFGNQIGKIKVKSMSNDPVRNALSNQRFENIQKGRSELAETIAKQKASKAKK
jgi:hypothetical protein